MKTMALWHEADWIAAISALALALFIAAGGWIATRRQTEFLGHPRGLFVLFYAEMWERFSFYGMRALLVFYLAKHWLFTETKANLIYGGYNALVYITPVLGGLLADRYLGQRKAVVFGGLLLALGHGLMAVEGHGGQADPTINLFWLALSLIIVGSGFLKGNISVIVGQLYGLTDSRRDGAFTIFYMGVNVGATLGTILVGYLAETIGWSYGFGLAGLGMLIGLLIFMAGSPALLGKGEPPQPLLRKQEVRLYAIGVAAVVVIWGLIQFQQILQPILLVTGLAMLAYIAFIASRMDRVARERIYAILFLIALNPLFWGLFEQAGGSLNQYTDSFVDRQGVPASLFQSINPIYIILLAPLFAMLWQWLGKKGREPSAPAKFGYALLQVGLSFLVFVWGAHAAGSALTPVIFVFLIYLLQTTGELCLSPVGLSAMARLAPIQLGSFIMGAWFYMTAVGHVVAGQIGAMTGGDSDKMDKAITLLIYNRIGWVAIGVGLVVLMVAPRVTRWMHLDRLEN